MKSGFYRLHGEDLKQIEDFYRVQFGEQTALKVINHILDVIEHSNSFGIRFADT